MALVGRKSLAIGMNTLWQSLPPLSSLLLSLAVARLFGLSHWGNIVELLVVLHFFMALASWGNKEYLQRELARSPSTFNLAFSSLFAERIPLLLLFLLSLAFIPIDTVPALALAAMAIGRFLQQSTDVLVLTGRKFNPILAIEAFTLLLQVVVLLVLAPMEDLHEKGIYAVVAGGFLFKGILAILIFRKSFIRPVISFHHFKAAFFFAMLGVSSILVSRLDLVVVGFLLPSHSLGAYQIIMAILWNIQSGAMYLSGPFVHHFYRMGAETGRRSGNMLLKAGAIIVLPAISITWIFLNYFLDTGFTWDMVVPAVIFAFQPYLYLKWIFLIMKENKQHLILIVNLVGFIFLALILFLIDKFVGLNLHTILWGMAFQQVFLTIFIFVLQKINNGISS